MAVGQETDGGITSSYDTGDSVDIKVPYSFFGSIYDDDERNMIEEALNQDTLTMGPQVTHFQNEFAAMCGVKHAFATTNCTTGMHVATQVMDINEGDEVIVTPNTFIATSLVILKQKAIPVFADIDPKTFNIDPAKIEEKISPKTKAIYVVHYAGQCCDMDPINAIAKKHNLYVLEDCAHAPSAEYKGKVAGNLGDIGSFSFHSLKNMTTCGEGGMVTTNHDEWEKPIDMLRCMNITEWGEQEHYWWPSHFDIDDVKGHWGNNYRMNEVSAAVGRAQLRKLDMLTNKRIELGHYLNEGIKDIDGIDGVYEDPNCKHVYHLYTVTVDKSILGVNKHEFMKIAYYKYGIHGIMHYQPTYHFTGLKKMGIYGEHECPIAEEFFYNREFNLPIHPRLTKDDCDIMLDGLRNAVKDIKG